MFGKFSAPLSLIGAHAHCFAQVSKVQVYLVLASEKLLDALGREYAAIYFTRTLITSRRMLTKKPHG